LYTIASLHTALTTLSADPNDAIARLLIDEFKSARAKHANCGRCFLELYGRNPGKAKRMAESAVRLAASKS
jgi:hypothetical protein